MQTGVSNAADYADWKGGKVKHRGCPSALLQDKPKPVRTRAVVSFHALFTFKQPEVAGSGSWASSQLQLGSSNQPNFTMFVSFILLWICIFFFILCLKCQRPKNFPPGPPPLPILGNLLNLSLDNPMRDFERVRTTQKWDSHLLLIINHTHSYQKAAQYTLSTNVSVISPNGKVAISVLCYLIKLGRSWITEAIRCLKATSDWLWMLVNQLIC